LTGGCFDSLFPEMPLPVSSLLFLDLGFAVELRDAFPQMGLLFLHDFDGKIGPWLGNKTF